MKDRITIKRKLAKNLLTQTWLINRLQEAGVETVKSELSSVLNGTRKGEKVEQILNTSLSILNDYELRMSD